MKSAAWPALLAVAGGLWCGAGPAAAGRPVPDAVERAAAAYADGLRGVVAMDRHFSTVVRAGFIQHTEGSESGFVMNDGAYARIRYYGIADDGKPFPAEKVAQRDAQTNADWKAGKIFFKEPYDRRFIADYAFSPEQACAACAAGSVAVDFSSAMHDAQHGQGTMWIDAAAHVEKLTYVPYVLPPHATSGNVTETSSEALPGVWYVTRIDETYQGRAFLVTGTGTFTGTFDNFRRYATVDEGIAALDARDASASRSATPGN
jgi:hypothetical protein